ncbi:MAG: glycogen synthase [Candidatus Cloacimonetes bacterium]|nr:glycogen synthase [Candidatus Cloacimonadota bacterium]
MKVTMIAREFPPNVYGGAGVHLRYLVQELKKLMSVEVRCFGEQNINEKNFKVKGYHAWEPLRGDPKISKALQTLSVDLSIVNDVIDSDIVHAHAWYASFAGHLAKMLYDIPLIVTCHSLEPLRPWKEEQLGSGYKLSSWVEKLAIESADRIVAVSNTMKNDILKLFDVSPEKIAVIHNGIDLNKWKETKTDFTLKEYGIKDEYVLFVGRTTKQKGMIYLIKAAKDIKANVVFCTSAPDTKEVEDEIREKMKGIKNTLWINRLLKEEQYIELYSNASVFACPSIYEPFGIINLEAMACKTPVVASAVGGIKEVVVEGETGFFVEPANPEQLAEKINILLKDKALAKKFGENGRKRVEKYFDWKMIAKQTKNLYEGIMC